MENSDYDFVKAQCANCGEESTYAVIKGKSLPITAEEPSDIACDTCGMYEIFSPRGRAYTDYTGPTGV